MDYELFDLLFNLFYNLLAVSLAKHEHEGLYKIHHEGHLGRGCQNVI